MDVCGSTDLATSGDLSITCESAADPPDPSSGSREQASFNDLAKCMNDSLNLQDNQNLTSDFISLHEKDDTISLGKEDNSGDCYGTRMETGSFTSLDKCSTFPCSSNFSAGAGNMKKENEQTSAAASAQGFAIRSCPRSASLPSTLKLVPAIKGSREKLGSPPQKLSVTWAPDVYDPVPTAASHVPTNKSQRHRSDGKKNGRSKQKGGGKSSRGSSRSKEKKPSRKVVGSSSRYYKPLDDDFPEGRPVYFANMADFEVGRADAFCGSSFLKESVAQLHFPVTEAT